MKEAGHAELELPDLEDSAVRTDAILDHRALAAIDPGEERGHVEDEADHHEDLHDREDERCDVHQTASVVAGERAAARSSCGSRRRRVAGANEARADVPDLAPRGLVAEGERELRELVAGRRGARPASRIGSSAFSESCRIPFAFTYEPPASAHEHAGRTTQAARTSAPSWEEIVTSFSGRSASASDEGSPGVAPPSAIRRVVTALRSRDIGGEHRELAGHPP